MEKKRSITREVPKNRLDNVPAMAIRNLKRILEKKLSKDGERVKFRVLELRTRRGGWTAKIILKNNKEIEVSGTEKLL